MKKKLCLLALCLCVPLAVLWAQTFSGIIYSVGTPPVIGICLSNSSGVVASGNFGAGTTGRAVFVSPGSCDNAVQILVTNGVIHAWTNTFGLILLTNTFNVPRSNTNYVVHVDGWQYPGESINDYTYVPPGAFYATNLTVSNFLLAATGVGTALPLSDVAAIQWTVDGN